MESIGNKASSIMKLKKFGFNVPDFFIISSEKVSNSRLCDIKKIIIDKTSDWTKDVILRSSASCEDGKQNSFAGLFESARISNLNNIDNPLKKVINSVNSKKVQDYLKSKNLNVKPKISIIVQKFINGDVSGVVFNTKDEYIINSNFGLADSIVGGEACDEYSVNKTSNKITLQNKEKNSLDEKQIFMITSISEKISKMFGSPQDIEWTIQNGELFVLQSRPITIFQNTRELNVWDNSNIAESYSGIVLPLTCSFAQRIYSGVYKRVALASGVSKRRVEEYENIFNNMLGFFYGRFYYNMGNWYKMLTLFPGYKRNKVNFDRMISIRSKSELDKRYDKNVSFLFKIKYYSLILLKYLNFNSEVTRFKRKISGIIEIFNKKNIQTISRQDLLKEFYNIEKEMISVWHIPIENDFLVMTFHGLFIKQAKKHGLSDMDALNQLSGMGSLRTTEQIKALAKLAKNPTNFEKDAYFRIYGGRFANELKLESSELTKDSVDFTRLLIAYRDVKFNAPIKAKKINVGNFGNFFLSETKKYIEQREDLRILRAKVFSIARRIFIEIGKRMEREKIIVDSRDVFYLTISELESVSSNIKEIIKQRKEEYTAYKEVDPENVLYTDIGGKIISSNPKFEKLTGDLIMGRPCSSGEAIGKVSLIKNANPDLNKKYEIIVTETADPGWAPILSLCRGIIIEKGGVLSHISILARELGVPCIINVHGIMKRIKNNQKIYMNGTTGEIKIGKNN
jgi:phosphohistidine swiveling domain-containing protein